MLSMGSQGSGARTSGLAPPLASPRRCARAVAAPQRLRGAPGGWLPGAPARLHCRNGTCEQPVGVGCDAGHPGGVHLCVRVPVCMCERE